MKPIVDILEERVSAVMARVGGEDAESPAAIVKLSQNPQFGDYQANGVMGLAKKLKKNPRELALEIVARLDVSDMCDAPEVAGPGFINFRLKPTWLAERLAEAIADEKRLGIDSCENTPTVVVDFSGPNIAKQMHVGHLRSTIIGDTIARILEFWYGDEGRWDFSFDENGEPNIVNPHKKVLRQNHVGDWGTQFGKVILGLWHWCMSEKHYKRTGTKYFIEEFNQLKQFKNRNEATLLLKEICDRDNADWKEDSTDKNNIGDGERVFHPFLKDIHEKIKARRDIDVLWGNVLDAYQFINLVEEIAEGMGFIAQTRKKGKYITILFESLSRHVTTMVQELHEQEKLAWEDIRRLSLEHCQQTYEKLGVSLEAVHVRGESFYNDMLSSVISDLSEANLLQESDGAQCVFLDGFKTKEGEPLPMIVQKSDGAYLYATTDLAAIRYRVGQLKADRIIYVTDSRQKLHFEMLFACARKAGWAVETVKLEHVPFGSVLGDDGKPFKTRSGENVKLKSLLDEAEVRARKVVEEKNPDLSDEQKQQIAHVVGIGAVKYADLSNNLVGDYVFSWDKMLAMEGNTAPYMQYAYARVQSIFRKGQVDAKDLLSQNHSVELIDPEEIALAKLLLRYGEVVETVARDLRPHLLTTYLFDLAQAFSGFYTNCPVLKAEPASRTTRLLLCYQTAQTIRHGLGLLGIETIEQM